jgi:predicted PurR-regulated permease PerM
LASQNDFIRTSGYRTLQRIEDAYLEIRQSPRIAGGQVVGVATSVLGLLFTVVTVLIVAFYWMTEKAIIKRVMLGIVPIAKRDRAHAIWDEIESKIGGWTRGQLILMASIGVISGIAYRILDLPFWLPLAIFAGITELIPFIGPFLGGGVAVIVALSDSWQKALIVVIFVLILQQIEGAILVPRVMRNAVGLTPLTVILAVLVGGVLLGPLGSILAIPISAAVQVLLQELLHLRDDMPDTIGVGATVPSAREAQQIIEQRHESPIPDLVQSAGTVPEIQS